MTGDPETDQSDRTRAAGNLAPRRLFSPKFTDPEAFGDYAFLGRSEIDEISGDEHDVNMKPVRPGDRAFEVVDTIVPVSATLLAFVAKVAAMQYTAPILVAPKSHDTSSIVPALAEIARVGAPTVSMRETRQRTPGPPGPRLQDAQLDASHKPTSQD